MIEESAARGIDRRIGWIMSVGGAALLLAQAPIMMTGIDSYALWWNAGVAALAAAVLCFAAIGWLLPHAFLRICWRIVPLLGALLMLTAFASYDGPRPPEVLPWVLAFDAVISAYLLLWLPPWAAAVGTMLNALLVPLSALLFLGAIPGVVLITMPIHMSNVVYIAIFVGIRRRMIALRVAESAAERNRARQLRAAVEAEHQEQVSRMLHDEVLSVLTAAFRTRGAPSAELRAGAAQALDLLETPLPAPNPGAETCRAALDRLVRTARGIDPQCRIEAVAGSGSLPVAVADAVIGAAGEAMRNSAKHAGPGTVRTLRVRAEEARFEVAVEDDGDGFDPQQTRPESLGISRSIVGRMRALPGGSATISSRPGGPTSVELAWRI